MFKDKQRLHFATAIIDAVKGMKSLLFPVFVVLAANGFKLKINSFESAIELIPTLIILILFIFAIGLAIIKWITFTYWIDDGELKTEYGFLFKSKRYVPIERIQSLNYHEGIIHRLFNLKQVSIETAGGSSGGAEVELTAITKDVAQRFEITINELQNNQIVDTEDGIINRSENIIYKMTNKDFLLHATTSNGTGVVLASIGALISQLLQYIPEETLSKRFSFLLEFTIVAIVIIIVLTIFIAWVISVALTYLAYYNFTLTKLNSQIEITRGLLEKQKITIPISKIQAVKIIESPIRQMFGFAQVAIEVASVSLTNPNEKKVMLLPFIKKEEVEAILQSVNVNLYDFNIEMKKSPKQARPLFYRKYIWVGAPIILGLAIFVSPYFLLLSLLLTVILLLTYYQHKDSAFYVGKQRLLLQYRLINKVMMIVERNKIQSMEFKQTPFQKKLDMYTAVVHVVGSLDGVKAKVPHQLNEEVIGMYDFVNKND